MLHLYGSTTIQFRMLHLYGSTTIQKKKIGSSHFGYMSNKFAFAEMYNKKDER
jgi:hypothetical protein